MKTLFLVMLCTFSFSLFAGDKIGNGGDVIICPGRKTVVLDIYQGKEDWGFETVERSGTRAEIISTTLAKFKSVDPYIANKLLARAIQLEQEITSKEQDEKYYSKLVKLTKNKLVNISDEGVAELPDDCEVVQAATQIQSPFPGEVKFTFQKSIWNTLETDVQASLILHEVIYEHMISVKEEFSRSTRYFNAALHADRLGTVRTYFEMSELFSFRNLAIIDDGQVRVFGEREHCSVLKKRELQVRNELSITTTIVVGSVNVVSRSKDFSVAMNVFMKKYVSNNLCD